MKADIQRKEFDKNLDVINSLSARLGAGTFGSVFKGFYKTAEGEIPVAIKIFNSKSIEEHKETEGNILKSLDHPNIVKVYQTGVHPRDGYYIAMELCECTLKGFLQRHGIRRFSEKEARSFFIEICKGVQYLQAKQIIHRDLKFENILINSSNHMKIADFGLAKMLDDSIMTDTTCGSTHIMAPEIFKGKSYGKTADIWSLGIILYGMLTGDECIYKNVNRAEYEEKLKYFQSIVFPADVQISAEVKELIELILNPDPTKRPTIDMILNHGWCKEEGESLTSTQKYLKKYSERAQTKEQKTAARIAANIKKDMFTALKSSINQILANISKWWESYDAIRRLDPSKLDLRELHAFNLMRIFKLLCQVENMEFMMPNNISTKFPLQKLLDGHRLKEFKDMKEKCLVEIEELFTKLDMKGRLASDLEKKHLDSIIAACDAVVSKGDISKAFDYRELSRLYKACQSMMSCFNKDYDQMVVTVTPKISGLQRLGEDLKLNSDEFQDLFQEFLNSINLATDTPTDEQEEKLSPNHYLELYSISFVVKGTRACKLTVEKALKGIDSRIEARLKDLK
jgi:serine/threonine protein kinase